MTTDSHQIKPMLNLRKPSIDLGKAEIICVIGGPGVGKGTHCATLAEELEVNHVSVGDLLRAETRISNAAHKTMIEERMREGLLVPNHIVQEILEDYLARNVRQGNTYFLVDGFPRSVEQAVDFQSRGCNLKAVLHFHGSEETMRTRMLKRAKTSERMDDTVEIFQKRFEDFIKESEPIIDFYKAENLYNIVDCEHDFDEVYPGLLALVKPMFTRGWNWGV